MSEDKQTAADADFWDAHKEAELDTWLQATPEQRLAWLADAIELAAATGALPMALPAQSPPVDDAEIDTPSRKEGA